MSHPLRILLWSPNGAGLHYGGAGTNVYRLYNSNPSPEIQVTLAHANPTQENYCCFSESVLIHKSHSSDYLNHMIFKIKARQWLRDNAHRFDVFHGIDIFENTVRPAVYAEKLGLPAIVKPAIAGSGLASAVGFRKIFRLPENRRKLVKKLSAIVSISKEITEELLGYGVPPEQIVRIPNGVDTDLFHSVSESEKQATRESLGFKEEDFIVLFVGAITPRKQPDWIVEAAMNLLPEYPNLKVCFVGPDNRGEYAQELKLRLLNSEYSKSFQFFGHQVDVAHFYQIADVYCLPSRQEGMPNSVLEASASGLPCIVGANSGTDEVVIDNKSGFFVHSIKELQSCLQNYLSSTSLMEEHGSFSRTHILNKFSAKIVFNQYLDLFGTAGKLVEG